VITKILTHYEETSCESPGELGAKVEATKLGAVPVRVRRNVRQVKSTFDESMAKSGCIEGFHRRRKGNVGTLPLRRKSECLVFHDAALRSYGQPEKQAELSLTVTFGAPVVAYVSRDAWEEIFRTGGVGVCAGSKLLGLFLVW
jgi:hypothetical protein